MLEKLKAWIANIIMKIAEGQQRKADYFILNTLTDRQLKDMGITRGELKQRILEEY